MKNKFYSRWKLFFLIIRMMKLIKKNIFFHKCPFSSFIYYLCFYMENFACMENSKICESFCCMKLCKITDIFLKIVKITKKCYGWIKIT